MNIQERLNDLMIQALDQQSHYYVHSTAKLSLECILELKDALYVFGDSNFEGTYLDRAHNAIKVLEKWGLRK